MREKTVSRNSGMYLNGWGEVIRRIDGEGNGRSWEYDGAGRAVLYGRGEVVAVSLGPSAGSRGGTAYLGKDALGSVRSATNSYGALEGRYEYDAFGKPYTGDLSSGMNLGYTGKPYDALTGLYDYGYRDYQPVVARFTTVDPARDGANWFAYVNNDPVNWIDRWGLCASDLKNSGSALPVRQNTVPDIPIVPSTPMPQTTQLTRAQNLAIGIGEMAVGVAIIVGGIWAAGVIAATAPPASAKAFSTVGYTGVIVGSSFFAFGLSRVAGTYNSSVIDDLKSVIVTPMAEAFRSIRR